MRTRVRFLQFILKILSRRMLKKHQPDIIAITGSVGKTTTKEAIAAIFEDSKISYWKTPSNFNNEIGVPLTILGCFKQPTFLEWPIVIFKAILRYHGVQDYPQVLILEMAADKPGDISYLTSFIPPKIAVITAIGPTHLEAFGTVAKVAEEKAKLVLALADEGRAILNSDDVWCRKIGLALKVPVIWYGFDQSAKIKILGFEDQLAADSTCAMGCQGCQESPSTKTIFHFSLKGRKTQIASDLFGRQTGYFLAAALAIGDLYGFTLGQMSKKLENLQPLPGRGQILAGWNHSIIVDEAYNASPLSMQMALENLVGLKKRLSKKSRLIAVLGDMEELGDASAEVHQDIAKLAKATTDIFIGVGPKFKSSKPAQWFRDANSAANYLLSNVRENDIILVKGSHAIGMDEIVRKLT